MCKHEADTSSYEKALAAGFKPVEDLHRFLSEKMGITVEQFEAKKHEFVAQPGLCNCATAPGACKCIDYCAPSGTRIIQYCGPNGMCNGNTVTGTCTPYG